MAPEYSGADLQTIIDLANQIISGVLDSESQVAAVESYADKFAQWFSHFEKNGVSSADEKSLKELSSKHEKVLAIAVSLKDDAADSMQEFRARARAIMKYVDQLPRKISLKRTRKG